LSMAAPKGGSTIENGRTGSHTPRLRPPSHSAAYVESRSDAVRGPGHFGIYDVFLMLFTLLAPPVVLFGVAAAAFGVFYLLSFIVRSAGHTWTGWAVVPAMFLLFCVLLTLGTVVFKWLLVFRYSASQHTVRSCFFLRRLFITYWLAVCQSLFLDAVAGTPLLNFYYRALGAGIGRRTLLFNFPFTEPDLIRVGDDCVVEQGAVLFGHIVENRVMTLEPIKIGNRCYLGAYSVILNGSSIQDGVKLASVSLVLKRDGLMRNRVYAGSPCKAVDPPPLAAKLERGDSALLRMGRSSAHGMNNSMNNSNSENDLQKLQRSPR